MIYILLPAYNEERSLDYLLPKISKYLKDELNRDYHIIACNDGSSDRTLEVMQEATKTYPMTIINHIHNRGLGETIRDLFEMAAKVSDDGDIIIRMDCDDTHEPEFMKGLIDKIEAGFDVVVASRFAEGGGQSGVNGYRLMLSRLATLYMKFFFYTKGLKEYTSGYRAYKASVIKYAIDTYGNNFIQLKGLGFSCTLEKVVKLKMLGATFTEAPMMLRYDQKKSESKMSAPITTLGYFVLAIMYHWPFNGWKRQYKKIKKLH